MQVSVGLEEMDSRSELRTMEHTLEEGALGDIPPLLGGSEAHMQVLRVLVPHSCKHLFSCCNLSPLSQVTVNLFSVLC